MHKGLYLSFIFFIGCQSGESEYTESKNTAEALHEQVSIDPIEISKTAEQRYLTKTERVWELIPWTSNLATAKQLSKETQRPIFLFSMHGDLEGRC